MPFETLMEETGLIFAKNEVWNVEVCQKQTTVSNVLPYPSPDGRNKIFVFLDKSSSFKELSVEPLCKMQHGSFDLRVSKPNKFFIKCFSESFGLSRFGGKDQSRHFFGKLSPSKKSSLRLYHEVRDK